MTALEKTQELADVISADPVLVAYREAKTAYETDTDLQEKLMAYNRERVLLGQEFMKDESEQDAAFVAESRARIDALASEIVSDEVYKTYSELQQRVNELMAEVNRIISETVFGVDPNSCTHDCSSCHSSCASRRE